MSAGLYTLAEVCHLTGLDATHVRIYVEREWLVPAEPAPSSGLPERYDLEDVARARLIYELQTDFGVNDAAVPVVLHLLDQLYGLRACLSRLNERRRAA